MQPTDDIDTTLYSLEQVMRLLAVGPSSANSRIVDLLAERFAELNELSLEGAAAKKALYEAYHLAYAIKVTVR